MATHLPQNKFYPAPTVTIDARSAAATPCPHPLAAADALSVSDGSVESRHAHAPRAKRQCTGSAWVQPSAGVAPGPSETAAIDSCQEPVAADCPDHNCKFVYECIDGTSLHRCATCGVKAYLRTDHDPLQALGALSDTDLIHEIFAVKPKHFKLKHKRRIALPRFTPDYEGMEAAMNDPEAPRLRADDPMWTDASPMFLRDV